MGHHSRKEDKELVQAILGGEMRNAWQPTAKGEGKDERTEKAQWNPKQDTYRNNYDTVFGEKNIFFNLREE